MKFIRYFLLSSKDLLHLGRGRMDGKTFIKNPKNRILYNIKMDKFAHTYVNVKESAIKNKLDIYYREGIWSFAPWMMVPVPEDKHPYRLLYYDEIINKFGEENIREEGSNIKPYKNGVYLDVYTKGMDNIEKSDRLIIANFDNPLKSQIINSNIGPFNIYGWMCEKLDESHNSIYVESFMVFLNLNKKNLEKNVYEVLMARDIESLDPHLFVPHNYSEIKSSWEDYLIQLNEILTLKTKEDGRKNKGSLSAKI